MTREEHLKWCKKRAIQYVDAGDDKNAFASMMSDLGKHEETKNHAGIQIGMLLMLSNQLGDMRRFIEGFN